MKLVIIGALVFFVGYWMVQAPDSLATFTHDGAVWIWDMASTVMTGIIDFLGRLFS